MEFLKDKFKLGILLLLIPWILTCCLILFGVSTCGQDTWFWFLVPLSAFLIPALNNVNYSIIKNKPTKKYFFILVSSLTLIILGIIAPLIFLVDAHLCYANPQHICAMPSGMTCSRSYLSSSSDFLNITIVNGLQKAIIITNVSCTKDRNQFEPVPEIEAEVGEAGEFLISCNDDIGRPLTFESGDTYSGKINIGYYFQDENPGSKRKLSGYIYEKAS